MVKRQDNVKSEQWLKKIPPEAGFFIFNAGKI